MMGPLPDFVRAMDHRERHAWLDAHYSDGYVIDCCIVGTAGGDAQDAFPETMISLGNITRLDRAAIIPRELYRRLRTLPGADKVFKTSNKEAPDAPGDEG